MSYKLQLPSWKRETVHISEGGKIKIEDKAHLHSWWVVSVCRQSRGEMWGEDCDPEGLSLLCPPHSLLQETINTLLQPTKRENQEGTEAETAEEMGKQSIGESRHLSAAKWSITSWNWGLQQYLRTLQSCIYKNIFTVGKSCWMFMSTVPKMSSGTLKSFSTDCKKWLSRVTDFIYSAVAG